MLCVFNRQGSLSPDQDRDDDCLFEPDQDRDDDCLFEL